MCPTKSKLLPAFAIIITAAMLLGSVCDAQKREARVWKNREGREIKATLSYVKDGNVLLKLASGRDASVPFESLSDQDQAYLKDLRSRGLARKVLKMPLETKIDKNVKVETKPNENDGGVPVYLTHHFEFHNDNSVTKAFIMEASRIFEGTHAALSALPLGLEIKTPEGMTHFKTSFQSESEFRKTISGANLPIAKGNIAGVYISTKKAVFVPYSQMGVKMSGSKMSLKKSSDTSTLIHEISHQLMHDWIAVMPLWLAEGLAEYVSAIPYQSGRFNFKNAERGLKDALEKRRISTQVSLPEPSGFLKTRMGVQSGQDYAYAMLYVYYFMHLDRPEAPGASLAAYLELLGEGRANTQILIAEFNDAVDVYNERIDNYKKEVAAFRVKEEGYKKEVDEFNDRVRKHNELLKQGLDPEGKVEEIGKEPTPPTPPKDPVLPPVLEQMKKKEDAEKAKADEKKRMERESGVKTMRPKTIVNIGEQIMRGRTPAPSTVEPMFDVYKAANDKAFPTLMRGRDFEQLKSEMTTAYKEIGLDISFSRMKINRQR